jgi:hypothetical protein
MLARTGGHEVYAVMTSRLSGLSDDVVLERSALVTSFILRAVAERARAAGKRRPGRPQLDQESFVRNLIAMVAAGMSAPLT